MSRARPARSAAQRPHAAHVIHPPEAGGVRASGHVVGQQEGGRAAVAAGPVVVQRDAECLAHGIQAVVGQARIHLPAHAHGADVRVGRQVVQAVMAQAARQDMHVEGRVVRRQHGVIEQRPDMGPELGKGHGLRRRFRRDARQPDVEGVKMCLRIDQRGVRAPDHAVFHHGQADGAHPVIPRVRRFDVENQETGHGRFSAGLSPSACGRLQR